MSLGELESNDGNVGLVVLTTVSHRGTLNTLLNTQVACAGSPSHYKQTVDPVVNRGGLLILNFVG